MERVVWGGGGGGVSKLSLLAVHSQPLKNAPLFTGKIILLYRCNWSERYMLLFLGIIKLKTLTPEIHIIRKTERKPVDCILLFCSNSWKMCLFRFANTFILVKNVNLQTNLHSKHHVREMAKVHKSHMDDQQNCADRNSWNLADVCNKTTTFTTFGNCSTVEKKYSAAKHEALKLRRAICCV